MFKKTKEASIDKIAASPQFKSFMKTISIAGIACTAVGLLLNMQGLHTGATLLIVGMSTLAIVSFFLGQMFPYPAPKNEVADRGLRPMWKFAMTVTGYSLAVVLMGLLFWMMHWSGCMFLMTIGVGTLALCGLVWLYIIHKKNSIK